MWEAFDGRPHELRMGLRPLLPTAWTVIAPPPDHAAELDRKAALLAGPEADDVLADGGDDGARAAGRELRDALIAHLVRDHPDRYGSDGSSVTLADDARTWAVAEYAPLDLAGRIVSEDWCLVRPGDPPVLAAATLCSPNRWRLREKLGLPVTDIHDPVPGYRGRLGAPVDAVLANRRNAVWRRNWSILSSPSRFQPHNDGPENPEIPAQVWVRSEYETLVRLPVTGWWVFGIHTSVRPIVDVADRPELLANIRVAVASLDPDSVIYKDMAGWCDRLLGWIDTRLGVTAD